MPYDRCMDIATRFGLTLAKDGKRSLVSERLFLLALLVTSIAVVLAVPRPTAQGLWPPEPSLLAFLLPVVFAAILLVRKRRKIVVDQPRRMIRVVTIARFGSVKRKRYRFDDVRQLHVEHGEDSDFLYLELTSGERAPINDSRLPPRTSRALAEALGSSVGDKTAR